MEWQDIKAEMTAFVAESLSPYGYKFVKSQDSFERKSDCETRFVFLGYVAKKNSLHMMRPWCGIRNAEIERIFHRTSGVDSKYQRNYTVINVGTTNYLDLESRSLIEETKDEVRKFLESLALPLLERDYTLHDYSRILNINPPARCPYHANPENRCHYGLICAKLTGDPSYNDIKETYSAYLQKTNNGFYYPRFLNLINDIEDNHCPVKTGLPVQKNRIAQIIRPNRIGGGFSPPQLPPLRYGVRTGRN